MSLRLFGNTVTRQWTVSAWLVQLFCSTQQLAPFDHIQPYSKVLGWSSCASSWCYVVSKKSEVLPKPHGPMGWHWSPFPIASARHQLTLRGHEYGASVLRSLSVYSPAFVGTKLYSLVTEVHGCEKLAQSFYAVVPGRNSNPRLLFESDTLPRIHPPKHSLA